LRQHLLPLVDGELPEGLGVGLLDLLGRRGPQQVPVPLDRLVVGQPALVPAAAPPPMVAAVAAGRVAVVRRVLLMLPPSEEPVEQSHGDPPGEQAGPGGTGASTGSTTPAPTSVPRTRSAHTRPSAPGVCWNGPWRAVRLLVCRP
jgi:hypothetical protein